MIVAGIGASIFIVVGVQNASMQKLLKEGEFNELARVWGHGFIKLNKIDNVDNVGA